LITIDPEITEEAILTLASFQGVKSDWNSGEEPGRIHTEHRQIYNNEQLDLLTKLGISAASAILWRTGWREYTNYFSSDTTPLFIRTVCAFSKEHPKILDRKFEKKDGSTETIKDSVIKAAEYIEDTVSSDGLIKIKEKNIPGNQYRYWRDSPSSYRDERGNMPNITEPMVILDIQVLSAEALNEAANLVEKEDLDKATRWRELSRKIRQATIDSLWIEEAQYFAYGMHENKEGKLEQIKTIQSNAGWLLNSDFFDGMSEEDRQKYITGIVTRLFSDEMLTDAGIRCRSKYYMFDRDFADYHGSWVSWPVESYMIAKGLRKQGFDELADQIETMIINTVNMSGVNYEFFVIDKDGKVLLDPNKAKEEGAEALPIETKPENTIAWTVTATLRAKKGRAERWKKERSPDYEPRKRAQWIEDLEKEILGRIDIQPKYKSKKELQENRYKEPELYLDQRRGLSKAGKNIAKEVGPAILKQKIKRLFKREK
jgi:glycogen debranching enzyme